MRQRRRPGGGWGEPMDFVAHECPRCGEPIQWSAGRQRYVERGGPRDGSAHLCSYMPDVGELVGCYCGADIVRFRDGHATEQATGRLHKCPEPWRRVDPAERDEDEIFDGLAAAYGPGVVAPRLPAPKPLPHIGVNGRAAAGTAGGVLDLE